MYKLNKKIFPLRRKPARIIFASATLATFLICENVCKYFINFNGDLDDKIVSNTNVVDNISNCDLLTNKISADEQNVVVIDYPIGSAAAYTKKFKEEHAELVSIICKYARMYGIDENLAIAMMIQENDGIHNIEVDSGGAVGFMQLQYAAQINEHYKCWNFEDNCYDEITVDDDNIRNKETHGQIAMMCLRKHIDNSNLNIFVALQKYNYGAGKLYEILSEFCRNNDITLDELYNNPEYTSWIQELDHNYGDYEYIYNVLNNMDFNEIRIKQKDGDDKVYLIYDFSEYNMYKK